MPNIKSAVKRAKTSEKRRALRASQKSALRTAIKKFEQTVANASSEEAQAAYSQVQKKAGQSRDERPVAQKCSSTPKVSPGEKDTQRIKKRPAVGRFYFGSGQSHLLLHLAVSDAQFPLPSPRLPPEWLPLRRCCECPHTVFGSVQFAHDDVDEVFFQTAVPFTPVHAFQLFDRLPRE